jgi:predicted nucleic acid-binding protein
LRFVLDTNVVVSALLLSESISRQAFDKVLTEGTLLISVPILIELAEVLRRPQFNKYVLEEEGCFSW